MFCKQTPVLCREVQLSKFVLLVFLILEMEKQDNNKPLYNKKDSFVTLRTDSSGFS